MERCEGEKPACSSALTEERSRQVAVGEDNNITLRKPQLQSVDHSDVPSTASPTLRIVEASPFSGLDLAGTPSLVLTTLGPSSFGRNSARTSQP